MFMGTDPHSLWSTVNAANEMQILGVLTTLGLVSAMVNKVAKAGNSVLEVIRRLRGKPKPIVQLAPGESHCDSDTNSTSVSGNVHQLFQNRIITKNIYNVYGKALERENIEDIESHVACNEKIKVVVIKEDDPLQKKFDTTALKPSEPGKDDTRIVSGVYLNPRRGAYSGDGSQWSFHRGSNTLTANVKDEKFLKKVQFGEIRPHYTDLMTVTLAEKQKVVGTRVTVTYEILSVDNYEFGRKPLQLTDKIEVNVIRATDDPRALPPAPDESDGA